MKESRKKGVDSRSPAESTGTTNAILAALAVLATVGLLPWLGKSIYRDEGATLYSVHLSWSALWQQSRVVDLVLLPYYSLLHLWVAVSGSIEWMRSLSLLAFGLNVFVVGHLASSIAGRRSGVLAAIVAATNPLLILAALSARPYALSALTATLSVVALVRWLENDVSRWMWWFALASVATLLLQLLSVLVPLSVLVAAVVLKPQKFRHQWRFVVTPIGLMLAAVVAFSALTAPQRAQLFPNKQSVLSELTGPAAGGGGSYAVIILLIGVVAILVCVEAWQQGTHRIPRSRIDLFFLSVAWAVVPTAALVVISVIKSVYVDRYVTASAPGLAVAVGLLTGVALDVTAAQWKIRARALIEGAALGIAALLVISETSIPAAEAVTANLQGAATYLAVHVGGRGEIAIPDHALTAGINYYLARENTALAAWPQLRGQRQIEGFDLNESTRTLKSAPYDVWLVGTSVAGTWGFIRDLLDRGYTYVGSKQFTGLQVLHFSRTNESEQSMLRPSAFDA